jgi:hypothetical protein
MTKSLDLNRSWVADAVVVRRVDPQQYAGGYDFQWHVHAPMQLDANESDRSEQARRNDFRPVDPDEKEISQCAE